MRKIFAVAALLAFALVSAGVMPAQAASSIVVISGYLKDVNGIPLKNVEVTASTRSLSVSDCTDANGFYRVQAKANQSDVTMHVSGLKFINPDVISSGGGCEPGTSQTWYIDGTSHVSTGATNQSYNITTPATKRVTVNVVDDVGVPVIGAKVGLRFRLYAYSGYATGKWWTGEYLQEMTTNASGVASLGVFELATSDADLQAFCGPGGVGEYCLGGYVNGGPGPLRMFPTSDMWVVKYNPRPGVTQTEDVSDEWLTNSTTVSLIQVPTLGLTSPSSATVGSSVTVSSTGSIQDGLQTSSLIFPAAAKKSVFTGKKANLYVRSYKKPSTPGAWKKVATCTFTTVGKCKTSFKMTGTVQVQFRPVGFSASFKTKVIKKK